MALKAKHNNIEFGVGDAIRVIQSLKEGDKTRSQAFEGMVIGIKGREENKTFTVRRIGVGKIGIERIFPRCCSGGRPESCLSIPPPT